MEPRRLKLRFLATIWLMKSRELTGARGIAIPPEEWHVFKEMTLIQLSEVLKYLAGQVNLRAFRRHPRGPKKAQPKRTSPKNQPHVSTAKLLAKTKDRNHTH